MSNGGRNLRTGYKHHAIDVGVASAIAFGPSQHRRGIHISPPSAGTVSISFGQVAVANAGYTITTATGGFIRLCSKMGDDHIIQAMHVIGSAPATLPVTEIYEYELPEGE